MKINNVGNNFSFGSNQKTRFIPKVVKEKVAEFKEKQELKKEIKQVYDAVYLSKKQDADLDELNFVKPKLYFRDISCVASCILGDNIISLKKDFLDKNNWYRLKELSQDFEDSMFYTDKIALAKLRHLGPINRVVNIDKYELLEKDELLLHIAAYLAHELEHAYLFQTVLSTTGGKKMFFDGIKEYNSKAKFGNKARTLYPFCIFYKPTKPLPFDKEFTLVVKLSDDLDVVIPYKAKDIVDATINYKSGNNLDYFFNSQEVLAYFSMLDLHNKVDDIMPFLNVSDEIKEIQRKSALDKIKPYLPEND